MAFVNARHRARRAGVSSTVDDDDYLGDDAVVFLSVAQVMDLHRDGIARYSPTESSRIRDYGLLESAVMTPQQTFGGQYLYSSVTKMATAYLVGLALNHPFENGNKRVAFAACSAFLRLNGYRLTLNQDEAMDLTLGVVNRQLTREEAEGIVENGIELL